MHIILEDQVTGQKTVACVDRANSHCEILRVDEETLPALINILTSMKTPKVTIIAGDDPAAAGILGELGFTKEPHLTVWSKKLNGG